MVMHIEEAWQQAQQGGNPDDYIRTVPNGAHAGEAEALNLERDDERTRLEDDRRRANEKTEIVLPSSKPIERSARFPVSKSSNP